MTFTMSMTESSMRESPRPLLALTVQVSRIRVAVETVLESAHSRHCPGGQYIVQEAGGTVSVVFDSSLLARLTHRLVRPEDDKIQQEWLRFKGEL